METSTAVPSPWGRLSGIDVRAGLATTMDNEKLYTRLLIKFRDSQGDFAQMFAAARSDSDPSAAARAAHTLKGTAGNIGAKGVQAAAGELEHAYLVNAQPEEIDALLAKTLEQLAPVVAGLQVLGAVAAPETVATRGAATADPAQVQAALQRLRDLLQDGDLDAADALETLLPLVEGTPAAVPLKRVATAIADCDFDAALEHIGRVVLV